MRGRWIVYSSSSNEMGKLKLINDRYSTEIEKLIYLPR